MRKPIKPVKRETRRRRNISGHIIAGREPYLECRVHDLSQHGAMIVVESPSIVPDQFELAFHPTDRGRVCEVIWRRNRTIGVRFSQSGRDPSRGTNPCQAGSTLAPPAEE